MTIFCSFVFEAALQGNPQYQQRPEEVSAQGISLSRSSQAKPLRERAEKQRLTLRRI